MPRTAADTAMPISTPGNGMPRMPSTPPSAITSGNTTGRMKIAGAPRKRAPQPDRQHRHRVVEAEQRMRQPAGEAAAHAAGVGERGRSGRDGKQSNRNGSDHNVRHARL
jgi:hypothetical protein